MPPHKEPTVKLTISSATFNEIATAMEKHGYKPGEVEIVLIKDIKLETPVDYRAATIRKDAGLIAARQNIPSNQFVSFMEEIYQYIINGKKAEAPKPLTKEAAWK